MIKNTLILIFTFLCICLVTDKLQDIYTVRYIWYVILTLPVGWFIKDKIIDELIWRAKLCEKRKLFIKLLKSIALKYKCDTDVYSDNTELTLYIRVYTILENADHVNMADKLFEYIHNYSNFLILDNKEYTKETAEVFQLEEKEKIIEFKYLNNNNKPNIKVTINNKEELDEFWLI